MYRVGDIVEIVPTPDDEISQLIAGSIAKIVEKEKFFISKFTGDKEAYTVQFIELKDHRYSRSIQHWEPKNLVKAYINSIKEVDIDEKDVMSLLEDDNR